MELTVIKFNNELQSCSAQTRNEILVVFPLPEDHGIGLGDKLIIREFQTDAEVSICHNANKRAFRVYIRSDNVHDLRLPVHHGVSRTPSPERIGAA